MNTSLFSKRKFGSINLGIDLVESAKSRILLGGQLFALFTNPRFVLGDLRFLLVYRLGQLADFFFALLNLPSRRLQLALDRVLLFEVAHRRALGFRLAELIGSVFLFLLLLAPERLGVLQLQPLFFQKPIQLGDRRFDLLHPIWQRLAESL